MNARGMVQQRRRKVRQEEELLSVAMDYFYLGEEEGSKPNLVAVDRRTGMMAAVALKQKADSTGQKTGTRFLETLGYPEVVMQSDGERAIVKMKIEAAKKARGVVTGGGTKANGVAEQAARRSNGGLGRC